MFGLSMFDTIPAHHYCIHLRDNSLLHENWTRYHILRNFNNRICYSGDVLYFLMVFLSSNTHTSYNEGGLEKEGKIILII